MAELLRAARYAPDRLLHPIRRRAATARVRERPAPASLLVLCHGNICRSPFAERVLRRHLAPAGIEVTSVGFIGPNRPPPNEALEAARRHGVDLSTHRSRLLTSALARDAGMIVAMSDAMRRTLRANYGLSTHKVFLLGDFDPEPIERRDIRDPVEQPVAVFETVYARIANCSRALATSLLDRGIRPSAPA
jgi:protein-tyrosine phosphatase